MCIVITIIHRSTILGISALYYESVHVLTFISGKGSEEVNIGL